jgi:hypothetical protein
VADRRPILVDCSACETHLVLLPSELYSSVEGVDPGVIKDAAGTQDAMFAIVDADGHYTCPNPECQRPGRVEL